MERAHARTPLERTAGLLPPRLRGWDRVRAAIELARGRPPAAPPVPDGPVAGGVALHPAVFTRVTPAPLWLRGWRAWRDLDYVGRLRDAIVAPRLRRTVTIAIVSALPGEGRTTVAGLLGMLMAHLRQDRVVALDAEPGPGSLADLVVEGPYLGDYLREPGGSGATLTQVDARLGRGRYGLRVLSAPPGDPLDEAAYRSALERLRRFAGLLLVDCGPGLDGPAARAAVATADQVLVVTAPAAESVPTVVAAVDALRWDDRSVVVVANATRPGGTGVAVDGLALATPGADGLVTLPWSRAGALQLAVGGFEWERAPGAWVRTAHELAAALAADWPRLGLTT